LTCTDRDFLSHVTWGVPTSNRQKTCRTWRRETTKSRKYLLKEGFVVRCFRAHGCDTTINAELASLDLARDALREVEGQRLRSPAVRVRYRTSP
jgi:hypothetical protein